MIDAEGIVDIDVTGAEALDEHMDQLEESAVRLVSVRVRTTLRTTLHRMEIEEGIGANGFPLRVRDAVVEFQRGTRAELAARGAGRCEAAPAGTVPPTVGSTRQVMPEG